MQATIYVSSDAYQTAQAIKDLDYYDRLNLSDEIPDFDKRPGYHLKNANVFKLAVLPDDAMVITPDAIGHTLSMSAPSNLRGCIFDGAPNLPDMYAEIIGYWSGPSINLSSSGAAYFQCPLNEYMVNLGPDPIGEPVVNDRLLSEGTVILISGLSKVLQGLSSDCYIQISFPIDPAMVGNEPDDFRSTKDYSMQREQGQHFDQVFLKVSDILHSPDPDRIYIELLRNELIDYGYWY
ncbi:hypothetical protein GTP41_20085 [Pseudoduganella sp. DS3]|uniref:Uncharacterized protein n=1 Tax=Pseudoduganella guangdongensis TaxID=2692179 RepID=A0A6N9HM01_9BURK|nr:hypothetical protein [Pseudoduganella guangdongensis]MYN04396.1 hypothetical protein [Pseudoduganella guangdongensis]